MLKRVLLIAAILTPQIASAADGYHLRHHHYRWHRVGHFTEPSRVVQCRSYQTGLFVFSDCGQTFDPFAPAGF